jgi:dTDP-4-dehydrorhamnose 3,5-epimerase
MNITETNLPGVLLIEPRLFTDNRGLFLETYHAERYLARNIGSRFVQDNLSFSGRGVLRGLHYQLGKPQGKLVMALQGEVYDVAVDIRKGSPTFGRWVGAVLSSKDYRQIYIPEGFAHGFCVLSETASVLYKCTDFYAPAEERGLRWDDPRLAIDWPVPDPVLSEKDGVYPTLETIPSNDLPEYQG